MNTRELNFAYKVRHALNETAENLPAATTERLANARRMALSRKKQDSALKVFVTRAAMGGNAGGLIEGGLPWLRRVGLMVPLVVVAAGLFGIFQYEQQRRIAETAEIDAAVLADELPLSAYVDHGFNAYLAKRGE